MSKITYSTIISNAFNSIFSIVDTRTNVHDPRDSLDARTRTFVYDSDPFEKGFSFEGMPYIICPMPTKNKAKNESANGKKDDLTWTYSIIVRTVKGGSSNSKNDAGITDMLNICDDLEQTFNSTTIRNALYLLNIKNIRLNLIRQDSLTLNQREIFESEFELTHNCRLTISQ